MDRNLLLRVTGWLLLFLAWAPLGLDGQQDPPPGDGTTVTDDWDDDWDDEDDDWGDDESVADLQALLEVQVSSIAGFDQTVRSTPAAISILSPEDIRRGGHRTIADALKMVPGLYVYQLTSNIHSVAARGARPRFDNKLLVLVDGRAVYNDLFAGVYWDEQDLLLEDLDRVEVIRGPGATIWGANAVNGVINIVSRKAEETQGWLATSGVGDYDEGFGSIRYGGELDASTHYRAHLKYSSRESFHFEDGTDASDDWKSLAGGFRFDRDLSEHRTLSVIGNFQYAKVDELFNEVSLAPAFSITRAGDDRVTGTNLLVRLEEIVSDEESWFIQTYYDRAERDREVVNLFRETYDLEYRHTLRIGDRHRLAYGGGFRHQLSDASDGSLKITFDPEDDRNEKTSAFVQDTIVLDPDRIELMIGSKFEYNTYSGFEVQPSARLSWIVSPEETLWFAISRAVRTPARSDHDIVTTASILPGPLALTIVGTNRVDSEEVLTSEIGYRCQPSPDLTLDVNAYFNRLDKALATVPNALNPLILELESSGDARVYGAELSATWQAERWLRVSGSYQWYKANANAGNESFEKVTPENVAQVRALVDISDDLEFNCLSYYSDGKNDRGVRIPSYIRLDAGLTWRVQEDIELSIWGKNLTDPSHLEGVDTFVIGRGVEVPRSFYAQISVQF